MGNVNVRDVREETAKEELTGPREKLQEHIPQRSFWGRARENWSWEEWGRRSEHEWLLVARGLDALLWAAIGALLGTTVAGIPAVFVGTTKYLFVVWQPLGAGLGAIIGLALAWARWEPMLRRGGRSKDSPPRRDRPL